MNDDIPTHQSSLLNIKLSGNIFAEHTVMRCEHTVMNDNIICQCKSEKKGNFFLGGGPI